MGRGSEPAKPSRPARRKAGQQAGAALEHNISIILVEPQMGENIGAAARVMVNFGFTDLRIVNPRDGWPNAKAHEMAAHADFVIENAKIFASLEEAGADLEFLYASSARKRGLDQTVISPREITVHKRVGFVFGGERSGLNNDDIALCDAIISIPVGEYKSINLAMSVGIICYEASQRDPHPTLPLKRGRTKEGVEMATKADLNSLFEHLETELDSRNFFQVAEKKLGMMQNIKTLLTRAAMSKQESQTLRGIIRSLAEHKPDDQ